MSNSARSTATKVTTLLSGDCYVTDTPGEMLVTILGSCVAACMRDPFTKVGGMNHFLLPFSSDFEQNSQSMRYGAYAMECLINEIIKRGGRKENIEVKVFGGANITSNSIKIGSRNATFVRAFLHKERMRIAAEHLGDVHPRRLHYFPETGRVQMRTLGSAETQRISRDELRYAEAVSAVGNEAELF